MNAYTVRRVVWLCAVVGGMAAVPTESQAIFHWFGCGGCGGGGTTAFRPIAAAPSPYMAAMPVAPACNTGCSPCGQTCNYMPQTCYRTVLQQVPVTAFQPVASCDPCGNQVTAMRPVVTFQTQARLVPFTTYRPVYTPMTSFAPVSVGCPTGGCPTSGCNSCGSNVSYASPVSSASGCSSCSAASTPSYSNPVYSSPAPSYSSTPSYSPAPTNGSSTTPTPALSPSEPTRPQTFQQDDRGVTDGQSRLKPIPDEDRQDSEPSNKKTNSTLSPRLLEDGDRTTYRPLKYDVIPVSAADEADANDGWRPARR